MPIQARSSTLYVVLMIDRGQRKATASRSNASSRYKGQEGKELADYEGMLEPAHMRDSYREASAA
jgi:hypothetical protein